MTELTALDYHTEGEPMRIVVDGVERVPGATLMARSDWLAEHGRDLMGFILYEPRGHAAMCAAILTEPVSPGAHAGVLFIEPLGPVHMCGHGAMAVATMLVDTGRVRATPPETAVTLDTPAGPVACRVRHEAGRSASATIRNVPAFSVRLDAAIDVPGLGPVPFDLAYGGHFYAMVPAAAMGLALEPAEASRIIAAGERIRARIEAEVPLVHPEMPDARGLLYIQFFEPARRADARLRNAVVVAPAAWTARPAAPAPRHGSRISTRGARSRWASPSATSPSSGRCSPAASREKPRWAGYPRSFPRSPGGRGPWRGPRSCWIPAIRFRAGFSSREGTADRLTSVPGSRFVFDTQPLRESCNPKKTRSFWSSPTWHAACVRRRQSRANFSEDAAMETGLRSRYRTWLEILLPLYTIALLYVYFHPQSIPQSLADSGEQSLFPWAVWGVVGAMSGILALSALFVAFFLLYSPVYLAARGMLLVGKGGWADKRELRFYSVCFVLLCMLLALAIMSPVAAAAIFVLIAGSAHLFWRAFI